MEIMAIPFPDIDPVLFSIGPVKIRWYGLAYLAGLVLGWLYMRHLLRQPGLWRPTPMTTLQADDFLLWATLGVVLGGRIGYFLFYEPNKFLGSPWQFFIVWKGGMAFHGGLLGMIVAVVLFARLNRIPILSLGDLCAAAAPFGLFFGRIANFINGEMYGRLTNVPWAVEFPKRILIDDRPFGPRHPTQLYEAFLEGIVIFFLIRYLTHSREAFKKPGFAAGVFLIAYACARIFVEFFKEWDDKQFFTVPPYFSEGMVYSLPMLIIGVYFVLYARRTKVPQEKTGPVDG
jgi:phosphatidylglycerol:prolipoprotein diacylglycerol transferase